MQKIPRAIGKASGVAVGDTNSSGTLSVEGGGLSVFAGVVTSRRGKPFTVLSINKGNFKDILGAAFHPNEQPLHYEPLRHLNQALNGGPGYVVRVVPSDMQIPYIKFSTPGNSNVPVSPPDVDATKSTFTAVPGSIIADGKSAVTLSFTAKDKDGNLLKGLTFVGFDTTGASVSIGKTVESNGVYTADMTGIIPGKVIVRPTVARKVVGNLSRQITIDPLPNQVATMDPDQCQYWLSNSRVLADGKSTLTLYLQLKDTDGQPLSIEESRVAFVSLGSITVSITDAVESLTTPGLYTAKLSGTEVGSLTVVPTVDGGLIGENRGTIITMEKAPVTGGGNNVDPDQCSLTADKTVIRADGTDTVTLTFTARNRAGALLPGLSESLSLAVYGLTGITKTAFTEDASTPGVYTTILTLARSSTGTTGEIHILNNGFSIDDLAVTLTADRVKEELPIVDDSASSFMGTANEAWATGGNGDDSVVTLTLTLVDMQGQSMPNRAVTFDILGAANSGLIAENAPGVYTVNVFSYNAASVNVVPMLDGLKIGSLNWDIEFKQPPVKAPVLDEVRSAKTFNASPDTIPADGVTESTLTLNLVDTDGKRMTGLESSLGIDSNISTLDIQPWLEGTPGFYVAKVTSEAEVTAVLKPTFNGKVISSASRTLTVTKIQVKPDPAKSRLSISPASINDDGSESATLTLELRNASNKLLSGLAQRIGFAANDLAAVSITEAVETGNGTGIYTSVVTGQSVKASVTIHAQFDGANIGNRSVSLELHDPATVQPPKAVDLTGSTLTVDKTQIRSDKSEVATITFTAKDASGATLTDALLPYLTFKPAATTGYTVSHIASHNDGTYTATVTATSATVMGSIVIDAMYDSQPVKVNGADLEVSVMMVGAIDATKSVLNASGNEADADGADTITLSLTPKDASGTTITDPAITFGFSGTNAADLIKSNITNTKGVLSMTISSHKAGDITVTAMDGADRILALSQTVTFDDIVDTHTSTLAANPTSVVGDGVATTTVTVTLKHKKDGSGLTGLGSRLTLKGHNGSNDVDMSGVTLVEGGNGVYSGTFSQTVTADTTITINPVIDGSEYAAISGTVTFTAPAAPVVNPVPGDSTFTSSKGQASITADGVDSTTLTLTLKNGSNAITSAQTVAFVAASKAATTTISAPVGTNGVYTATVKGTAADEFDVTVTVNGSNFAADGAPVHVKLAAAVPNPPHASATDSTLVISTAEVQDDTTNSGKSTVTLTLKNGATPIDPTKVELDTSGKKAGTTVTALTKKTPGVYTATITAPAADTFDVKVKIDDADFALTPVKQFVWAGAEAAPANSKIEATPTHVDADGTSEITLNVTLKNGTVPIKGRTVTLEGTGMASSAFTLTQPTEAAAKNGTYSGKVKATAAGTLVLKVKVDGKELTGASNTVSVTFDAVAAPSNDPVKAGSSITLDPAGPASDAINADTDVQVLVALKNAQGTAATGLTVADLKLYDKTSSTDLTGTFTEDATTHGTYKVTFHVPSSATSSTAYSLDVKWKGTALDLATPLNIQVS